MYLLPLPQGQLHSGVGIRVRVPHLGLAIDGAIWPRPSGCTTPAPRDTDTPEAQVDDADIDLLDDDADGGDGDSDDDDSGGAPAEITPLGPPPEASPGEQAAWRAQHGIPDRPDGYVAPQVEGLQWNAEAISPIAEIAHQHNIPAPAFQAALEVYAEQVAAAQDRLKTADAERQRTVRSQLTPTERRAIEAFAKGLDRETRQALRSARSTDGSLLIHKPGFLRMLTGLSAPSDAANARNDELRLSEIRRSRRRGGRNNRDHEQEGRTRCRVRRGSAAGRHGTRG